MGVWGEKKRVLGAEGADVAQLEGGGDGLGDLGADGGGAFGDEVAQPGHAGGGGVNKRRRASKIEGLGEVIDGGLEFRGELIRLVRTLRGGDRPKNAEEEFPGVCSMARGCYEPWGIFRKPMGSLKVSDCLREWQTGGLRRYANDLPFEDVIESERTPQREREMADHPSLKPQSLMRRLVWAALPLGEGVVVDPFMGSGSTVAAAEAVGVRAIGVERFKDYYDMGVRAIPKLSALRVPDLDTVVGSAAEPALFRR